MPQSDYYLDKEKKKNGIRMPLFKPDGGLSEDFIMVKWGWCDDARKVRTDLEREMRQKFAENPVTDTADALLDAIVVLVASWGGPNFKEKATPSRVRKFLKERPDIAERIDDVAVKTNLFFPDSGTSS